MIRAVIFDMDGTIIDSEPFWRKAEIQVFSSVHVQLSENQLLETMGMRTDEVVAYWYEKYRWSSKSCEQVEKEIHEGVKKLIVSEGKLMSGVKEAIQLFQEQDIHIALASSSSLDVIETTLQALGVEEVFAPYFSAENEEYGKPHPAVYHTACSAIGQKPEECLAIEDSLHGLTAAKKAGMKTIVVPDPANYDHPGFSIADIKLHSLKDLSSNHIDVLNAIT